MKPNDACPCGSSRHYADCCGRLHLGQEIASTAEALMRSRYSAYVLGLEPYLLASWHASTRPAELGLEDGIKWLALEVKRHQVQDASHATVEFVARYRSQGRGQRLQECSSFVKEDGRWFYVDGLIP